MKTLDFVHILAILACWKANGLSRKAAAEKALVQIIFRGWNMSLCGRAMRLVFGGRHAR